MSYVNVKSKCTLNLIKNVLKIELNFNVNSALYMVTGYSKLVIHPAITIGFCLDRGCIIKYAFLALANLEHFMLLVLPMVSKSVFSQLQS